MISILKTVLICSVVSSYKLFDMFIPTQTSLSFYPCYNMNPNLTPIIHDVFETINNTGLFDLTFHDDIQVENNMNNISSICNIDMDYHRKGYTRFYLIANDTDILIDNSVLYYNTNTYNVLLHEVLHSLGLNHTTDRTDNMVSYGCRVNQNYQIIRDDRNLFLSYDDFQGLEYIANNLLEKDEAKGQEKTCKKKMIRLINKCLSG